MADQDAIQLSPSLLNSPLLLSLTHSPFIISLTPPSPLQSYTLEEIRVKCWSAIITMAVWAAYTIPDAQGWLTITECARTHKQQCTLWFSIKVFSWQEAQTVELEMTPESLLALSGIMTLQEFVTLIIGTFNYYFYLYFFHWSVKSSHILPVAEKLTQKSNSCTEMKLVAGRGRFHVGILFGNCAFCC